jgi:hypothetical protein
MTRRVLLGAVAAAAAMKQVSLRATVDDVAQEHLA